MVEMKEINLNTGGDGDTIDITPEIRKVVQESALKSGTATVFITGSTAGVTTIEYEPGVVSDLKGMFDRIIPKGIKYTHDRAWGDGNGHSHVKAALLGPSLVVPFNEKQLLLGTWQQVVLVDFDNRSRTRKLIIQVMGD